MEKKRIRSIDIMKGIAMIMVIMVHLEQSFGLCKWFDFFQMGCPIFFVCSGFGIISLINKRYPNLLTNKLQLSSYYISRFKALAPGWYLALFLIFIANTLMLTIFGRNLGFGVNQEPLSIILNLAFLNGLFPFCNNNVMAGGWYIGATAILYCITPLILLLMGKFKNRKLFFIISSVIVMTIWFCLIFNFKSWLSLGDGYSYFIFLVHYPEYLLGILLYFDLNERLINEKQSRICLLLGIIAFFVAFVLFYFKLPYFNILSAWMTALATYLVLYNMVFYENIRTETRIGKILTSYGKNSYGIFLMHPFFVWPFIIFAEKVVNHFGLSIKNIPGFIIMIPIVLLLCYVTGVVFNKIIKMVTKKVFR